MTRIVCYAQSPDCCPQQEPQDITSSTLPPRFPVEDLPPELFQSIFSVLKGDRDALRSCSLVSHLWADVTRPLLFSTVTVDLLRGPDTFASFGTFCTDHVPLSRAIEELTLSVLYIGMGSQINLPHLVSLLPNFPRLRCLSLENLTIQDDSSWVGPPYPVKRLRVQSVLPASAAEGPLLPLFSFLAHFAPQSFEYGGDALAIETVPRSLSVKSIYTLDLCILSRDTSGLDFLQRSLVPGHLRSLSFCPDLCQTIPRMCDFVSTVGSNLVDLRLNLCTLLFRGQAGRTHLRQFEWPALGATVSSLRKLESLLVVLPSFRCASFQGSADEFPIHYNICTYLFSDEAPRLSLPPALRSVTVRLNQWRDTRLDYPPNSPRVRADPIELYDIPSMDRTLSRARCSHLEDVTIEIDVRPNGHLDVIKTIVAAALPRLGEAGLLKVAERVSPPPVWGIFD